MAELVVIGKVKGGHGAKGALKVLTLTDFPERFAELKRIFLTNDMNQLGTAYEVENVTVLQKYVRLKLFAVNDVRQAWDLNNYLVVLPLAERVPLAADSYYISDLLGSKVVDQSGNLVGTLVNVIETGASDVLVIENQGREVLLPALREVIKKVDLAARVITVEPWADADGN